MQQQTQNTTPNLARLRIDNIKPKWVTCVWLAFFVLIGILFLLTLAIPESVVTVRDTPFFESDLSFDNPYIPNKFDLSKSTTEGNYSIFLLNRDPRNQFILVEITPTFWNNQRPVVLYLNYTFSAYEVAKGTYKLGENVYPEAQHRISLGCNLNTRICENRTIIYINEIDSQNYMLLLQFQDLVTLRDAGVKSFTTYITYINSKYTDFLLALRYLCLGITLIFLTFYWLNLRKMRGEKIVYEQKFIRILGILLIFFNDPIYAATVLKPTLAAAVFSTFFLITFVCALLLFWISAFERIHRENTQVKTRILTWQKGVYIFFLWLFSVVAYIILSREYLSDPSFDFNDEYQDEFKAFKILMIIFVAIGLGWMFFEYVQILRKYNSRIWRHKMLFSFSTYFIFCYFIFMFTGTMSIYNLNGTKVMLLFGITNVYIWFLMVLYSPSGQGLEGADQPISLGDRIREFNNYEPLDESAGNIEMGKGPFRQYGNAEPQEEVASPDEIIFQLDNQGNVVGRNQQQQENRQQARAVNNNNFGFDANTFGNNPPVYGGNYQQDHASGNFGNFNEDAWKNQSNEDKKYPFEANEDGEGGDLS